MWHFRRVETRQTLVVSLHACRRNRGLDLFASLHHPCRLQALVGSNSPQPFRHNYGVRREWWPAPPSAPPLRRSRRQLHRGGVHIQRAPRLRRTAGLVMPRLPHLLLRAAWRAHGIHQEVRRQWHATVRHGGRIRLPRPHRCTTSTSSPLPSPGSCRPCGSGGPPCAVTRRCGPPLQMSTPVALVMLLVYVVSLLNLRGAGAEKEPSSCGAGLRVGPAPQARLGLSAS